MMGDQVVEKMRTFIGKKKTIRTTPNYDILANPKYQTLFQWTPLQLRSTPEDGQFSDLVTQILKVGYKRDDKPIQANFDKVPLKKHAKAKAFAKEQIANAVANQLNQSTKGDESSQLL